MANVFSTFSIKETKSNAERKVFYALKDLLPGDYTIIHSLPVYKKSSRKGPLKDGEIDFLILHPDKGMIALEVKGGGIQIDPVTGNWYSINYYGEKNSIKNPYEQAKNHIHTLSYEIKNHERLRKFKFPFGHAVWFPDIDLTGRQLGVSTHLKGITLCSKDLDRTPNAISQLFNNTIGINPRTCPSKEGVKEFIKFYTPSKKIVISLSSKISTEKEKIFEATESQYNVLSLIERFNRVSISGSAGCGKTFLALEKARRIAENNRNKKVVIVCFNKTLSMYLKQLNPNPGQIDIFHFHGLCIEYCKKANLEVPFPDPTVKKDFFFKKILPDCLLDALDQTDFRYDALIVDEGQDFLNDWWLPLQEILNEPEEDMFYLFFDDNQLLYGNTIELPLDNPPISLSENCRNTKCIHSESMKYYKGLVESRATGPQGRDPEIVKPDNHASEIECVDKIINDLIKKDKIFPGDITILTPIQKVKSIWNNEKALSKYKMSWDYSKRDKNTIFCSTIYAYKGLESPVIILTELKAIFPSKVNELMYIATTRANSHLIVINDS